MKSSARLKQRAGRRWRSRPTPPTPKPSGWRLPKPSGHSGPLIFWGTTRAPGSSRPFSNSLEDFEKLIAINVRGLFVATQEAARHLREGGRIIHIGSTTSERLPFIGSSVYALTKGAVAGFTKGLARDLGPRGITVNNVQPGPIDTDMNPADSES